MQQLSAQDASFIYLETAAAPMHLGSLCIYEGTADAAADLSEIVAGLDDQQVFGRCDAVDQNP